MAISQDKVRTIITIPKDLKKELEKIAEQDNRSFNNKMEVQAKGLESPRLAALDPDSSASANPVCRSFRKQFTKIIFR